MAYGVGIDVSKQWLDVHVHGCKGERRFPNTAAGLRQLRSWLGHMELHQVVLEATGGYELAALDALSLRERGWGEGTGRSPRVVQLHEASPVPSSAPAGHLLPAGEGKRRLARPSLWWTTAARACTSLLDEKALLARH
ncbi:hypothetical protein A7D16_11170 [Xanthomonas nasturtii]|nr:hypothetical protein A7D16_11170 [Xanthomonas nasturtii]